MRRPAIRLTAMLVAIFAAGILRADIPQAAGKHRAVTQEDVTLVEYDVTLRDTVATGDAAATFKRIAANHRGMAVSIDEKTRHAVFVLPVSRTGELMKDAVVKSAVPAATPATGKRIQQMKPIAMTSTPWDMAYQYDGSGNVTSIGSESYTYDGVNRLTSATLKGYTQNFQYDEFGNIVSTSIPNANGQCTNAIDCVVATTVNSNTNRLEQTTVLGQSQDVTYDNAGNITGFYNVGFTWDSLGMMTSRTDTAGRQFVYDENDERIGSFYYENWTFTPRDIGGRILREYSTGTNAYGNPTWTTTAWHWHNDQIYRGDQVLASVGNQTPFSVATPVTQHFHLDHLGSTRLVTVDGHEVSFHNYFPFGTELATAPVEDPAEMSHKFAGHETEDDNNGVFFTYNMHARSYLASAGRFMSLDPARDWDNKKPQSWNLYSYVQDNPETRLDPTGRCGEAANFIGPRLPCPPPPPPPSKPAADVFVFASATATSDTGVRPAVEGVLLVGYNSKKGGYAGRIFAGGIEAGSEENYVASFKGVEKTSDSKQSETITMKEGQVGVEVPFVAGTGAGAGTYKVGDERGVFVYVSGGVIGQDGAFGIGVSLDTFKALLPYIKTPEIPGQDIQPPSP